SSRGLKSLPSTVSMTAANRISERWQRAYPLSLIELLTRTRPLPNESGANHDLPAQARFVRLIRLARARCCHTRDSCQFREKARRNPHPDTICAELLFEHARGVCESRYEQLNRGIQ